jgi:antitoxin MazE
MKTAIKKWGNSLGVRIPKTISEKLDLFDGTDVELILTEDGILIQKPKKETLEDVLNRISESNKHSETDFGDAQGEEIW